MSDIKGTIYYSQHPELVNCRVCKFGNINKYFKYECWEESNTRELTDSVEQSGCGLFMESEALPLNS